MRAIAYSICTFAILASMLTGCQQGEGEGQVATQKLEPKKAIIGTWSVDTKASEAALGDEPLDMSAEEAFGQLKQMVFEFTDEKLFVAMGDEKQEANYKVTSETEDSLDVEVTPVKEGEKTETMTIKFSDADRFTLIWKEFQVDTIWTRNDAE